MSGQGSSSLPPAPSGLASRKRPARPWEEEGFKCPFLDTINRMVLDFDFEKACSVTGHNFNVYACLVCGKYFQGRGKHTQAYTHSLQEGHHIYMNLGDGKTYCLPDSYEVVDSSLSDIQNMLAPCFSKAAIATLDTKPVYSRGVDGADYMPGLIGLNNIKGTDYVNVIIQCVARIPPLRDFFLLPENYAHAKSPLVHELGALVRKVWSPHNFKGQVSPHELLQAIMHASGNKFRIGSQADPMDFLAWLLNTLHTALGGTRKAGSSIIHKTLQGGVRITTARKASASAANGSEGAGGGDGEDGEGGGAGGTEEDVTESPFLYLTVDVPAAPLFKDALERNIIPQVPLAACLTKFDGATEQEMMNGDTRRYTLTKLPPFLIVHIKRFSQNTQQFLEKNPTIVNFPVKNLEMGNYTVEPRLSAKYHLMASVQHDGTPDEGAYRAFVHFRANDQWYEVQDLHVNGVHPQLISVSESYIQVWRRADD